MILPQLFLDKMKALLGEEYADFIKSYDSPCYTGLRANGLKIQEEYLQHRIGADLSPVPWCPEGFYYEAPFRPAKEVFYHCGLYYMQEPSAMCAASVFDVYPGQRVLDLCAAPGGKSTHLGAKLAGEGVLVANDISATRCKALAKNIELMGITNALVTSETPDKLVARFNGYFDRILIDAPCSGEGMFRKDPESVKNWDESKGALYSEIQKNILFHADKMLAPGGRILYSTCTFAPEENECLVKEFLNENRHFTLLPIDHRQYGFDKGRPEWADGDIALERCGRLWPHKLKGEGHFLAYLEKEEEENSQPVISPRVVPQKNNKMKELESFYQFCKDFLHQDFLRKMIVRDIQFHRQSLFMIPDGLPSLQGIRVVRSGFHLGDMKAKRFEPSQALAMGIKKEDAKFVIDFSSVQDQNHALRYLKGESFEWDGADGWNLICMDGFPLGWGKVQDGRIKNKYSRSWMMN